MQFLRLRSGNRFDVRFVGPALFLHCHYESGGVPALKITRYAEEERRAMTRIPGKEEFLRTLKGRLASCVIDLDEGKVKMVDLPRAVYRQIMDVAKCDSCRPTEVNGDGAVYGFKEPCSCIHPGAQKGIRARIDITGSGVHTAYDVRAERHTLTEDQKRLFMANRFDPYVSVTSYAAQLAELENARQQRELELETAIRRLQFEGYTVTAGPATQQRPCSKCTGQKWLDILDRCDECNREPMFDAAFGLWRGGALVAA